MADDDKESETSETSPLLESNKLKDKNDTEYETLKNSPLPENNTRKDINDRAPETSETSPLLRRDNWKDKSSDRERLSRRISWRDIEESSASAQPLPIVTVTRKKRWILLCILMVELCERVTFFGIQSNLFLFCTSVLEFDFDVASDVMSAFLGTTYCFPILGGFVADAWATQFTVIFGSCLIYLPGLLLILSASLNFKDVFNAEDDLGVIGRRYLFFFGLALVIIGSGGMKATVGPFGAQQVQGRGAEAVHVFFHWFYWFANAGCLIAYCGVSYVQQNVNFSWGLLIPVITILFSMIFLNLGWGNYIHRIGQESVLVTTLRIFYQACFKKSPEVNGKKRFFDSARKEHGGSFDSSMVDGVISILHFVPILLCLMIFWTLYSQMKTTYYSQGMLMDLSIGSLTLPVTMLNAFCVLAVMMLVPFLDRVVYPLFKRIGHPISYLQRMGIGFFFAASSVFVGGWLEIERKDHMGFNQTLSGVPYYASDLTIFLQVPQFILMGAAEAFACIASYQLAYTQAHKSMQGLLVGAFLATSGVGFYLHTRVRKLLDQLSGGGPDSWYPPDFNRGKIEYVLFVYGGLMLTVLLIFLFIASKYTYRDFIIDRQCFDQSITQPKPKSQSNAENDERGSVDEPVAPLRRFSIAFLEKYKKRFSI